LLFSHIIKNAYIVIAIKNTYERKMNDILRMKEKMNDILQLGVHAFFLSG